MTEQKRTDLDIDHYKEKLEKELSEVMEHLVELGRINPDNPEDWEPVQADMNVAESDANEVADKMEEFEMDAASLKELEIRYNLIKIALGKIEDGTYGLDEIDGEPIPKERLEVNPAARTKIENVYKVEDTFK